MGLRRIAVGIGKRLLALPLCAAVAFGQCVFAQSVFGQSAAGKAQPEITITAVASAIFGDTPLGGIRASDLTLLDNKVPTQIASFRELDPAKDPVDVILVVDTVNTGYEELTIERDQIDKFLLAGSGRLARYTSLVVFKNTDSLMQENPTTSGAALSAVLDKNTTSLRTMRPAAVSGDAERLQLSLALLTDIAKHQTNRPGRKSVIWISPGWPLLEDPDLVLSAAQQDQIFANIVRLSAALREAGITLYNIDPGGVADSGVKSFFYKNYLNGVGKPSQTSPANLSLQVLATQSGGLVLVSNDLPGMLRQCVTDSDHLYELTFSPPAARHPNEYHHLRLKTSAPRVAMRTRDGYYAQPVP